ncbi:MAG: C39 family peptidase [Planctomycetota bacterium]|nr:MAG: C39 family peptidase [Planctomycetota bacterium]
MSIEPIAFLIILFAAVVLVSGCQADSFDKPSLTNQLKGTPNDVHALIIDQTAKVFRQGDTQEVNVNSEPTGVEIRQDILSKPERDGFLTAVYKSRLINTRFPFNEMVPSYNIDVPADTGFIVELRVGRQKEDFWTPFYSLGSWGTVPQVNSKTLKDENGLVDVDYFRSRQLFDRIQYRVHLCTTDSNRSPVLRRFGLAYSHTLNDESLARSYRKPTAPIPRQKWARRIPVPFRSQKLEDEKIRASACSPTSLAMVLEYRGIDLSTALVAKRVYDPEYKIYGNWARAVQGAYLFGVPGYLARFSDWNEVKQHISNDTPIIASIKVAPGELRGAPYKSSDGHIFVITGFSEDGDLLVNDPAGATPQEGLLTYNREDMEKVWFGHGGVGYVLLAQSSKIVDGYPE